MVHSKKQIPITGIANPVNLLDEGGYFRIIGALPRIPEEYIRIHLEQNRLTISATETGSGKKRKMIGLLIEIRREKKNSPNGILVPSLDKPKSG